jgi:hypothetical protein
MNTAYFNILRIPDRTFSVRIGPEASKVEPFKSCFEVIFKKATAPIKDISL